MWWTDTEKVIDAPPLIVYLDRPTTTRMCVFSLPFTGLLLLNPQRPKQQENKVGTSSFLHSKERANNRQTERERKR